MDDLMARTMVENLCLGIDPLTGKSLHSRDICSNKIVQEALRTVLENCTLDSYATVAHRERMEQKKDYGLDVSQCVFSSSSKTIHNLPWTPLEDERLREFFARRYPIQRIANIMGRTPEAILKRLEQLKLLK